MNKAKLTGMVLAIGAASVFALSPVVATAKGSSKVHCYGVNACKGKGGCKSVNNACRGKNACKGKGFVTVSKAKCEKLGGHFEKSEKGEKEKSDM